MRWGIRAIIGESFAEIFYSNCLAIGIPCFTLPKELIKKIQKNSNQNKSSLKIDINKSILINKSSIFDLEIKNSSRKMFLSGEWDATSTLLKNADIIEKKINNLPYIRFTKIN